MTDTKLADPGLRTFDDETINELDNLIRAHGCDLLHWQCYGQPAVDGIHGITDFNNLRDAFDLIERIITLDPRLGIDIFPLGIPSPVRYQVQIRAGRFADRGMLSPAP